MNINATEVKIAPSPTWPSGGRGEAARNLALDWLKNSSAP